jgi:hypothetical protein
VYTRSIAIAANGQKQWQTKVCSALVVFWPETGQENCACTRPLPAATFPAFPKKRNFAENSGRRLNVFFCSSLSFLSFLLSAFSMFLVLTCLCALCGEGLAKTLAGCAGSVTTLSGSPGGYSGRADGPAKSALFSYPWGAVFDGADTIYVTDNGNNIIRAVAQSTGAVSTLVSGGIGFADGVGSNARFYSPIGLTYNQGNLFIADANNCIIRQVVISSRTVTTLAGSYCGYADGTGKYASFDNPNDVVTRNGDMFVADVDNNRIRRITMSTMLVTTFAGGGYNYYNDGIGTQVTFRSPNALSLDASGGKLFISDSGSNLIRIADTRTAVVTTLAGGAAPSGPIDGVGRAAYFNVPVDVATDSSDNLFVVELCGRVRVIDLATATVYTVAGGVRTGLVDGLGSAAVFREPRGIAVGPTGKLFIGDSRNNVIRAIDAPCTQTIPPTDPPVGAIVGGVAAAVVLIALGIGIFIKRKSILSWIGARTKLVSPDFARALAERGHNGPQAGEAKGGERSSMSPLSTMQPPNPPPPPIFMPNIS